MDSSTDCPRVVDAGSPVGTKLTKPYKCPEKSDVEQVLLVALEGAWQGRTPSSTYKFFPSHVYVAVPIIFPEPLKFPACRIFFAQTSNESAQASLPVLTGFKAGVREGPDSGTGVIRSSFTGSRLVYL